MAITKTDFINYSRCPRYISLEEVKKDGLDAFIDYKTYQERKKEEKLREIFDDIFETDSEGNQVDLTDVVDEQLKVMLPYYKLVEEYSADVAKKIFDGEFYYAEKTKDQECFDTSINGIRYLCYLDIFNESSKGKNVIEVKATTSRKYFEMGSKIGGEFHSVWTKINNIHYLKDEINDSDYSLFDEKRFAAQKNKLFDRYGIGKYVFDLAIQRYIIEHELEESNNTKDIDKYHYYLAVLNHNYVFDGTYIDGNPVYNTDSNGEELITFFDMTEVTKIWQDKIDIIRKQIERYILNPNAAPCPLGAHCQYKTKNECKYFKTVCGKVIPEKYSSLTFMSNGQGFLTDDGTRLKGLELINEGYLKMIDIPDSWITRKNHQIQKDCVLNNRIYVNKEKLMKGINSIKYPIYHLDFETFPCPVPRYFGEKPYTQSVFEFSLHIEREPGVCDKDKDCQVFLAKTHDDCRLELVKKLVEWTGNQEGTLFAQNVPFEKGRIKELAEIFPEYKKPLMKLYNNGFDLLWLINTSSSLYESLGYDEEESKTVNYYNPLLNGSYSIKKSLPLFSDLSYKDLDVKNGTEAIVTYAKYNIMDENERRLKYDSLYKYCKQDTWAMVVVLDGLRKL